MKRGVGDGHAAHEHRPQPRDRGQHAGAADLHVDVEELGQCLLGLELVSECEARGPGDEADGLVPVALVDLVDDPVDVVGQRRAALADVAVEGEQAFDIGHGAAVRADRQPERAEPVEERRMRAGHRDVVGRLAQAIGEEAQRPLGGQRGIELAQAAGCGIAGIHEGLVATGPLRVVHPLEVAPEHEHLAAHLQATRRRAIEPQRDRADGAQVGRHILADGAVATRGPLHEAPVLVAQADRQAVELQLRAVAQRRGIETSGGGGLAHAPVEAADIVVGECVLQRQHRQRVPHLAEAGRERAADAPGRRLGRGEFGMGRLELLQLAEQAVVLRIGHRRRIEHVVRVIVVLELGSKPLDAGLRRHPVHVRRHGGSAQLKTRSAAGEPASSPASCSER